MWLSDNFFKKNNSNKFSHNIHLDIALNFKSEVNPVLLVYFDITYIDKPSMPTKNKVPVPLSTITTKFTYMSTEALCPSLNKSFVF